MSIATKLEKLTETTGHPYQNGPPTENSVSSRSGDDSSKTADTLMSRMVSAKHSNTLDTWLYESWIELLHDDDYDHLYSSFNLTLDIDTEHFQQDIFIEVSLVDSYNEESVIYTSDTFSIYNDSSNDDFRIEASLSSGFEPDGYKIIVSIYDVYTHERLTHEYIHDQDTTATIPLESREYDELYDEVQISVSTSFSNGQFYVANTSHTQAGSFHWLTLSLLMVVFGFRNIRPLS